MWAVWGSKYSVFVLILNILERDTLSAVVMCVCQIGAGNMVRWEG